MHMKRSPVGAKGVLGTKNPTTLQENPLTSQMRLPWLFLEVCHEMSLTLSTCREFPPRVLYCFSPALSPGRAAWHPLVGQTQDSLVSGPSPCPQLLAACLGWYALVLEDIPAIAMIFSLESLT